jgi:hypothetical protein
VDLNSLQFNNLLYMYYSLVGIRNLCGKFYNRSQVMRVIDISVVRL